MAVGLNLVRGCELVEDGDAVIVERHSGWTNGWVAKVSLAKPGSKYDLDREFLAPDQQRLSRNGNGQKIYFLRYLSDGYYEAESVFRSFQSHRVYFEVRGHSVVRVLESKNELKAELAKEAVGSEA